MVITFLFPDRGGRPCGGNKIVYEYANRLVADGNIVNIVYSCSLFFSRKNVKSKLSAIIKYFKWYALGYSGRKWFLLDKHVKEYWTLSLNHRHVPKSDVYICTTPYTAMYLKDYNIDDCRKYYFIQGYERWGCVTDDLLRKTYHYPFHKIVVSTWLQTIIENEGLSCDVAPNGFDFKLFSLKNDITKRDRYTLSMVYSPIGRKGCQYGIEAINIVKSKYPQLRATFFGTTPRPADLPEWITYCQSPDDDLHIKINNDAAIFVGASLQEGWGLPVGEAMACGQAVVCTDNPGYMEMAVNGVNTLVSPVCDAEKMAENIIRLIEDDELRIRIANQGHVDIQKFSIDESYRKFKKALGI